MVKSRRSYALRGVVIVVAAAGLAKPATGQTANTTTADVNVLNLLSPFLSLTGTSIGQQTLTVNLNDAVTINQYAATSPVIAAVSISDKAIFSGNSTSITLASSATSSYGPGANLAGGLPVQAVQSTGGIAPSQPNGGLGGLGTAFQAAVSPSGAAVPSVVTLLTNAYSFTSNDLGVAKNYFANGTINGTTTAVAPSGLSLPTANGYPNLSTSVYDTAYGVSNTGANQDIFGDSRPSQVAASRITGYDPTALTGLASNPSFPSGHTNYAFTDSILIGMLVPQYYQSMLLRGSEYGQSRIDLGVHYPLDIIGSRAFASYDLAQLLNASNSAYLQTNVATGATAQNLNTQFRTAATALNTYLNTQTSGCGGSLAACAASNAYNAYSASTYGSEPLVSNGGTTTASINSGIYQARLTYGLPTLSLAQAPREQAPAGGPDASILLATVYGGSTAAAQALASSVGGALYGNLSTGTINQIIVNTETNAIAAFYGTSLSYWSRIDLYDAAGYFSNVTGTITLASGDQLKENVTVANTGILAGSGTITGNVAVQSGGALMVQGNGLSAAPPLTVNGTTTLQSGSQVDVTGLLLPGKPYTVVNSTGAITIGSGVTVNTSQAGNLLTTMGGTLAVTGDPALTVTITSNFAGLSQTGNQRAVASAVDRAANTGTYGGGGAALLTSLITNNTAASAPATFDTLSGEGLTGQQQAVINATEIFASTVIGQATEWGSAGDPIVQGASGIHAWATGFGQAGSLDGNAAAGSAGASSQSTGFSAGFGTTVAPGLVIGLAGGYSNSNVSVAGRGTSGNSDGGHFGLYGVQHVGPLYLAATIDYAHFSNTTNRTVLGSGENGQFDSNAWMLRAESGYRFAMPMANVTPFGGFQVGELYNNGFGENSSGVGLGGLIVGSQTVDTDKVFLGVQVDTKRVLGNGWVLSPFARIAWEHEFNTDRNISASFEALPGAAYTVYGASAASDLARLNVGVKLAVTQNVALFTTFDGAFSGSGNSYAGTGGVKVSW
jgi:outer membrane autotransporter protein